MLDKAAGLAPGNGCAMLDGGSATGRRDGGSATGRRGADVRW